MATAIKKTNNHKLYIEKNSLTDIWKELLKNYYNFKAVNDCYSGIELTYKELYEKICLFASGLQSLGLKKGDHVSLFSENSAKWLITDQAILMSGGVNAVRGSLAPVDELTYILDHSDSKGLVVENLETFDKLKDHLASNPLDYIVCLSDEEIPNGIKELFHLYSFKEVLAKGKKHSFTPVEMNKDEVATLVYTSGTTNKPKGVMLTHRNLLSQIDAVTESLGFITGESSLNMLPPWHIYERTCEYYLLSAGITMNYTNVNNFKADIKRFNPSYIISVPRIWEAVYNGIHTELKKQPAFKQKILNFLIKSSETHIKSRRIANYICAENFKCSIFKRLKASVVSIFTKPLHQLAEKILYKKLRTVFGKNFQRGICGGGALAGHLEDFYEAAGLNILVGYGLTETAPVLTLRQMDFNLKLSAGKPVQKTEIKIVNPETGKEEDYFTTGVVMARGPQVMKGYYKNQKATRKVLAKDGWFNTGDLGWLTPKNDLILTGRHKDLIVLSNGENIEPQPLEDACLTSPYIDQIVLVGQDKNHLGALIYANEESIKNWANRQSMDSRDIHNCPEVQKLLKKEINKRIQSRSGYRAFERVQHFKMITDPFTIENGLLTRTMKLKKAEIQKRYESLIEEMYKK